MYYGKKNTKKIIEYSRNFENVWMKFIEHYKILEIPTGTHKIHE